MGTHISPRWLDLKKLLQLGFQFTLRRSDPAFFRFFSLPNN